MSQANFDILGALLSILVAAWPFLRSFAQSLEARLTARLPGNMHNLFVSIADEVTRATEQLRKSNQISDAQRKQNALDAMTTILDRLGFNVKDEKLLASIGTYIESAVASLPNSGATGTHNYDPASVPDTADATFLLDTAPASDVAAAPAPSA